VTPGTRQWVTRSLRDWALGVRQGMALVTYQSHAARGSVIHELEGSFKLRDWTTEILECGQCSAGEFVSRISTSTADVLFVLDPDRLLFGRRDERSPFCVNFQHETLVGRPGVQIWWLMPQAAIRFGQDLPDLSRFFLFREELKDETGEDEEASHRSLEPAPEYRDVRTGNRERGRDLLARALHAAGGSNADAARVWLELGLPALSEFVESGYPEEASAALDQLTRVAGKPEEVLDLFGRSNVSAEMARAATVLSVLYWHLGRLKEAFALAEICVEMYRQLGDRDGLQASYGNQALIFHNWGRLEEAMALHQKEEAICLELGDRAGLQRSYGNQAVILRAWGRLEEAMALHQKQEAICLELGDRAGLPRSYGNQALILRAWGRLDEAMALHKKEEAICLELGYRAGLQASYGNQALILKDWGRMEEAMALHQKQEAICLELGLRDSIRISLHNQAILMELAGQPDEAARLRSGAEAIQADLMRGSGNTSEPREQSR
jgi:tetratricopeptide (TPR) repeat protein